MIYMDVLVISQESIDSRGGSQVSRYFLLQIQMPIANKHSMWLFLLDLCSNDWIKCEKKQKDRTTRPIVHICLKNLILIFIVSRA